jgi:predicted outer membrane repeat protein
MNLRIPKSAWRVVMVFVFAFSLAGISAHPAHAATFTVTSLADDGSAGTLRWAVNQANAAAGVDTINFSVSGTIILGSVLEIISDDLVIDGSGQSVTISGNHAVRILYIGTGVSVTLANLSIINAQMAMGGGGAIVNLGTLTINNSYFSGNSANTGGGISTGSGTLTITNSIFSTNTADTYGGAIDITGGSVSISGSSFLTNSATDTTAGGGGAIHGRNALLTITDSTFSGNTAGVVGGAVYVSAYGGFSSLTLANSTLAGNSAVNGGAIYNSAGTVTITNTTFSGNTATGHGGALYDDAGTLAMGNTILANSVTAEDCYRSVPDNYFNSHNLVESHINCATPALTSDPMLAVLGSNGGPTQTMALMPGSPALNAGNNSSCASYPVNNKDQRGVTRPFGAACDIGSFEKNSGRLASRSIDTQDGWILESGENTNAGGTLDSLSTILRIGDDAFRRQYRAVLSFKTASLPDTAVITMVKLKVKKAGMTGGVNPVTALQGFMADIRRGFFGTSSSLVLTDFQAAGRMTGPFTPTLTSGWYIMNLTSFSSYVNKLATGGGVTQVRLSFKLDDNNNAVANVLNIYSGNYATASSRPVLMIDFYVP